MLAPLKVIGIAVLWISAADCDSSESSCQVGLEDGDETNLMQVRSSVTLGGERLQRQPFEIAGWPFDDEFTGTTTTPIAGWPSGDEFTGTTTTPEAKAGAATAADWIGNWGSSSKTGAATGASTKAGRAKAPATTTWKPDASATNSSGDKAANAKPGKGRWTDYLPPYTGVDEDAAEAVEEEDTGDAATTNASATTAAGDKAASLLEADVEVAATTTAEAATWTKGGAKAAAGKTAGAKNGAASAAAASGATTKDAKGSDGWMARWTNYLPPYENPLTGVHHSSQTPPEEKIVVKEKAAMKKMDDLIKDQETKDGN